MSGIARISPRAGGCANKLSAKWIAWSGRCAAMPGATGSCSTSTGSEPTGPARKPGGGWAGEKHDDEKPPPRPPPPPAGPRGGPPHKKKKKPPPPKEGGPH